MSAESNKDKAKDFFTATDVTRPSWEREAALDRMPRATARFWAKDVTLPSWTRTRYDDKKSK